MSGVYNMAYQIGWLAEGCRAATRSLELIRDSESTPPETRDRLQLVIGDLQRTVAILDPDSMMTVAILRGGGEQ